MARGIRLTKQEREWLKGLFVTWLEVGSWGGQAKKHAEAIHKKLLASEETPAGVDIVPIEEALVASARGKVIALEGGHGMASVRAAQLKATPEDAALIGAYLARTAYFTQPMTVLDVFNKWHSWLPKARATSPPPQLEPGLGVSEDRTGTRVPPRVGKAAPGFR